MKNNQLLMGYAETDITPLGQIETIGFGRENNLSRGILHSLTAGISVWKMEGESGKTEPCCLITIDHIGFSKEHARHLRDTVGELIQGIRENVMLCFSHTHSAPNDDASPEYYRMVCERVKDAVKRACGCMEPVAVGWGNAYVDIGLNRRRESSVLDRRCGILKVCSAENGTLKLLILRLTAHGNVLKRDNYLISPDYFGAVRDRFEKEYGCTGYFPTEEEFDQGGYEVYWSMVLYYQYFGRVYPLRRNSASELMKFIVEGRM